MSRDAEAALAEAGDEALRDEIVPGIRDPFTNRPGDSRSLDSNRARGSNLAMDGAETRPLTS